MRVDVQSLDADFYVLSGHPQGLWTDRNRGPLRQAGCLAHSRPWQGGGNMMADKARLLRQRHHDLQGILNEVA
jgi:selenocysteine lyase/cysteine desulfurase